MGQYRIEYMLLRIASLLFIATGISTSTLLVLTSLNTSIAEIWEKYSPLVLFVRLLFGTKRKLSASQAFEKCDIRYDVEQSRLKDVRLKFIAYSKVDTNFYLYVLFAIIFILSIVFIILGFELIYVFPILSSYFLLLFMSIKFIKRAETGFVENEVLQIGLTTEFVVIGKTLHNWTLSDIIIEDIIVTKAGDVFVVSVYYFIYREDMSSNSFNEQKSRTEKVARIPVPNEKMPIVQPIVDALLARKNSTSIR